MNTIKEQMKNTSEEDAISSRIQVLCLDLRDFRDDFIRGAIVFGSCRTKNIPDKFKPKDKDLPDSIEGRLRISFSNNQHKFTYMGQVTHTWLINNTGLADYIDMLGDIWPEGGYSWLIEKPEHIVLLNKKANVISGLSEPLLSIKEYRGVVAKVRAIVRCNGGQWTDKSNFVWPSLEEIDEIVKELESAVAPKPAEAEHKATLSKVRRIWALLKKIPHWIYGLVIFLAALFTCIGYLLGWLGTIKAFIYRVVMGR